MLASIDTIFCDTRAIRDFQALAVNRGRVACSLLLVASTCRFRSRVRTAVQAFEVFGQLQAHDGITIAIGCIRDNGNIVSSPVFVFIGFTGLISTESRATELQLMI